MPNLLKRLWGRLNEPSKYDIWKEAFDKLQEVNKREGRSSEYWEIWHEEVCPAYRELTEATPKLLRHPLTDNILEDMDKPISERKHF